MSLTLPKREALIGCLLWSLLVKGLGPDLLLSYLTNLPDGWCSPFQASSQGLYAVGVEGVGGILSHGLWKGNFFSLYLTMFFPSSFALTPDVAFNSLSNNLFCFKKLYVVITGCQLSLWGKIIYYICLVLILFLVNRPTYLPVCLSAYPSQCFPNCIHRILKCKYSVFWGQISL